jgi:hypothetical protein
LLQENKNLKDDLEKTNRKNTGGQAQIVLLERTVRGLEEDNTRLANMYEQVSKSN